MNEPGQSIQTTTAPPDYELADQPAQVGPWQCAAHPSVETYLRCGRCERPICPKCMIQTPVGSRCRDCARMRKPPTYNPSILDLVRGAAGALAVAFGGGFLISLLSGGRPMNGFIGIAVMAGLGYLVGEATTRAARRRRGTSMAIIAAVAVPLGVLLAGTAHWVLQGADPVLAYLVAARVDIQIWSLLGMVVGSVVAFSRLR